MVRTAMSATITLTLRTRSGRLIERKTIKRGIHSSSYVAALWNNDLMKSGNYNHRWSV